MKVTSGMAILIAVGILAAVASPAGATCSLPSTFNTGPYYTPAPVAANPGNVEGAFWGLGQGNPSVGAGTDNGFYAAAQWLRGEGPGLYFAGDWSSNAAIEGCIQDAPNPQPAKMVLALSTSDTGTRGELAQGYFAVMCVQENVSANFDFSEITVGSLPLMPIPKPVITASSRGAGTINITVGAPGAISAGVYDGADCNPLRGYKIFSQIVPRNGPAPTERLRTLGWIETPSTEHATNEADSFTLPCVINSDVYLALGLVFESGFETAHVSRNSTKVECGPSAAGKPDTFRLIKKPKGVRTP